MTEQKFLFVGIHTDKNYGTVLAYMAETAQDAWNKCAELNPNFEVWNWGLAEHMVWNRFPLINTNSTNDHFRLHLLSLFFRL